jgi:hypothetical protein
LKNCKNAENKSAEKPMVNDLIGAVLLATGILAVVALRPKGAVEHRLVRFPGAWIIVGLLLTCWVGTGIALIAAGVLGL